jgi:PAS domain S-box-containing protein
VLIHNAGIIVEVSDTCAQMFNCESPAVVGRHLLEFTAPEHHVLMAAYALPGTDRTFNSIGLRPNGERFPVEVVETCFRASSLRVVAMRDLGERRIRERMRRRSDQENRNLAQTDFAVDGISVHRAGRLVESNEALTRMSGYSPAELMGTQPDLLMTGSERPVLLERIRTGDSRRFDSYVLRKDGTSLAVEICTMVISGGEQLTAFRDISQRRDAENALLASEDRFRDLVEHCNDLIGTHDLNGVILSANAAVGNALTIPSADLPGRNLRQYIEENWHHSFAAYLETVRRDGVATGTARVTTEFGQLRVWEYRSTLRTDDVTTPIVRILARDVTEGEESLAGVRHSEKHFRSIIENSPDLIGIIECDGTLRYHNPSMDRALGLTPRPEETSFLDFVHRDDRSAATTFLLSQIAEAGANGVIELLLKHSNGTYRSFEVAARNLTSAGVVTAVLVNARDTTDRHRLESQLAQANRLSSLGRLAATVAHEFNNVLMGIQPFAELMQRPDASRSLITKGAVQISNSIQRGKRIALEILRFTQPARPVTSQLDLHEWWKTFGPEAATVAGNVVHLVSNIENGMWVVADKQQLSQVMANLVSNARDAMPGGGTITLNATRPEAHALFPFGIVMNPERFIHISVCDTGQGMVPEVLHHIFEPLFTTKKSGGTGLGLAVTHQVISQHSGYVFAESEVGVGSTFHMFLPIGTGASSVVAPVRTQSASLEGLTLLMIEDEPSIVEGVSALLDAEGIKVASVGTGQAAEAAVTQFRPDVVLLDFGLPDIDGSEVYKLLRKLHAGLPVIFATGHGDRRAIHEYLGDSRTRFLQKPFEIATLLEMISDLRRETV